MYSSFYILVDYFGTIPTYYLSPHLTRQSQIFDYCNLSATTPYLRSADLPHIAQAGSKKMKATKSADMSSGDTDEDALDEDNPKAAPLSVASVQNVRPPVLLLHASLVVVVVTVSLSCVGRPSSQRTTSSRRGCFKRRGRTSA